MLSESGKLYNWCYYCKRASEFPKLHSKIDDKIVQFSQTSSQKSIFVIDGNGVLFEILQREDDWRTVVANRMGTKLRDNSTLKKVINVWQTYGGWAD